LLVACERDRLRDGPGALAGVNLVSTTRVTASLEVGGLRQPITGRVSLHLVSRRDTYAVAGFNVLLTSVPQPLLGAPAESSPFGLLGFAIVPGREQALDVDARTGTITGELEMYGDASFLAEATVPDPRGGDVVVTPTFPARLSLTLGPGEPLAAAGPGHVRNVAGKLQLRVSTQGVRDLSVPPMAVFVEAASPVIDVHGEAARIARQLCIQPVNVLHYPTPPLKPSGAGFDFGWPGAVREWSKAGVVFLVRDGKTLVREAYWDLAEHLETTGLRATVRDDDCIEVFLVNSIDTESLSGGGTAYGAGTASAQIVTSDVNARNGVDRTHLAHELGHVLRLDHPPPDAVNAGLLPSSTGTLMCTSGLNNDNPSRNSRENRDLVQNPLIVFVAWDPGWPAVPPDCGASSDCGGCPPRPVQ
jgi:hypothetical protein